MIGFRLVVLFKHPDEGKIVDMTESIKKEKGIDGYLKIYPTSGYGNPDMVRQIINMEGGIDAYTTLYRPKILGMVISDGT